MGQGQFGKVYCAAHRQTGRLVALKNLEQQRFSTHKFLRELRFLLSLQHPNIVACKALEHTPTGRYLVMDYCEGGTLRSLMSGDIGLNLSQTLRLVVDVLAGLDHAHSKGIVHCDIKPENVLLNLQPDGWLARITDFGIARLNQELSSEGTGNTGSPAYMAPERFYGQYSPPSDIYAVGVLFFELLAGHRPFSGTPGELMAAHLNHQVTFPDHVPEDCRFIVQKALQKLPARRFRSAGEMLVAVQKAMAVLIANQSPTENLPLLQPLDVVPIAPFRFQCREVLSDRLSVLSGSFQSTEQDWGLTQKNTSYLFRGMGSQVAWQEWSQPDATSTLSNSLTKTDNCILGVSPLPESVQNIWVRHQGGIVGTRYATYLVPLTVGTHPQQQNGATPQRITQLSQPFLATVEPKGHWMAIATGQIFDGRDPLTLSELDGSDSYSNNPSPVSEGAIAFLPLPHAARVGALCPKPVTLPRVGKSYTLQHLVALDARHLAVLSRMLPKTVTTQSAKAETTSRQGTALEIFTRRGNRIGALLLPVVMKQVITTPIPYQLLAIDAWNSKSILRIDLKPYRMARMGVNIEPEFLVATSWGIVVANRQGELLFMSTFGEQLGQIDGPPNITAIALMSDYTLLIATWNDDQGNLYTINIKDLDIGMLF